MAGAVRFPVHVQPRASRTEIVGLHGSALKVRVNAPPVDGAANDAVVALLAEQLGVPRANVAIVAGLSSRAKVVEARGVSRAHVEALGARQRRP